MAKVREVYMEDVEEGLMDGPLTLLEAQRKHPGLRIAATGALAKDFEGGLRVIHDGTHWVLLNQEIRVRDQVAFPGLAEARWILAYIHHWGLCCVGAKGDARPLNLDLAAPDTGSLEAIYRTLKRTRCLGNIASSLIT